MTPKLLLVRVCVCARMCGCVRACAKHAAFCAAHTRVRPHVLLPPHELNLDARLYPGSVAAICLLMCFIYLFIFCMSESVFRASLPSHTRVCHPLSCNTSSNWERHGSRVAGIAWVRIQRGITAESSNKRPGGGEDEGMGSARDSGAAEKTWGFCMRSDWRSRRTETVSNTANQQTGSQQTASVRLRDK